MTCARCAPPVTGGHHTAPTGISSPLVGRDRELSILSASLETLHAGARRGGGPARGTRHGQVAAGCGSQTPERRRARALARGPRAVLRAPPELLAVHRDPEALFRDRGHRHRGAGLAASSKQAARELFDARAPEIVPYLATVLALEMTGEYEQRVQFLDAQALGRQVFLSMRQLFERLAQRQPILLVMEDWHWVDHSSVALCEHLLPLTSSLGVLFWFVTRAEPGDPAARIRAAASPPPRRALPGDRPRPARGGPQSPCSSTTWSAERSAGGGPQPDPAQDRGQSVLHRGGGPRP